MRRAIAAGKHVYVEKPTAPTLEEALDLARLAARAGAKNGVIQDKVFLPGLQKLKYLKDSGFFGRILAVRIDFGWWVFDGDEQPSQRMSWNYRKRDGGGIVLDMYSHWRYVIDRVIAPVTRVSCIVKTHTQRRRDERGEMFDVDVDDAAYAVLELEGGIVATVTSSWATRVRRDDLLTIQIDGTHGSAVAGLHRCRIQPHAATPKPPWNADVPQPMDFYAQWQDMPTTRPTRARSGAAGRASCATSPRTRRSCQPCSRAPRACSLPSSPIAAAARDAGSACPRSRSRRGVCCSIWRRMRSGGAAADLALAIGQAALPPGRHLLHHLTAHQLFRPKPAVDGERARHTFTQPDLGLLLHYDAPSVDLIFAGKPAPSLGKVQEVCGRQKRAR